MKVTSDWLHKSTCLFAHAWVFTGVYPLFRRSAADLQGAAVRVHITGVFTEEDWDASARPTEPGGEEEHLPEGAEPIPEEANLTPEEAEAEDPTPSTETPKEAEVKPESKASRATPDFTAVQRAAVAEDESFPVTVAVDQAMHLNLNGEFTKKKKVFILPSVFQIKPILPRSGRLPSGGARREFAVLLRLVRHRRRHRADDHGCHSQRRLPRVEPSAPVQVE